MVSEQIVFTSEIPPCCSCKTKRVKKAATRRAMTLWGEHWDMCEECYASLAHSRGIVYRDWKEAPRRILHQVPFEVATRWDYISSQESYTIVGASDGRFQSLEQATIYAVSSARWFRVPVFVGDIEIWSPGKTNGH